MNEPKLISTWEALAEEKSETHVLEIDLEYGGCWVLPNEDEQDVEAPSYYLSTHAFYGKAHELSTKVLQYCDFNVVLTNWDAEEENNGKTEDNQG
jgi:hypothetical protein